MEFEMLEPANASDQGTDRKDVPFESTSRQRLRVSTS